MSSNDQPTTDTDFITELQQHPLATVAMFYASCLAASAKAVAYVTDELGLTIEQAIEQRIGFSDRTLGKTLPSKRLKAGRELRETLQSLGLYKANGRETLRGYVTVPIVDDRGDVIGIRGHQLDKHASGPETIVVGEELTTLKETKDAKEEVQSPAANPVKSDIGELIIQDNEIIFVRDDRRYRIRGLEKNHSLLQLKVNLMVSRDDLVHLDTLDLVKARSRNGFIKAAATELYVDADTIKKDIGTLLLKLEAFNSDRIAELKNPQAAQVNRFATGMIRRKCLPKEHPQGSDGSVDSISKTVPKHFANFEHFGRWQEAFKDERLLGF